MVASVETGEPADRRAALRRWFKLTGVVPVGLFLAVHVGMQALLLGGHDVYIRALEALHAVPFLEGLEIVFVVLPLAFHALVGLRLAVRPDPGAHTYASDRLHVAQRVSGVVAFLFIVFHVGSTRAAAWFSGATVATYGTRLESQLSSTTWGVPWTALGYTAGLLACIFHFANGLTSFSASGRGPSARRRAFLVFAGMGGLLFLVAFAVVAELATGTRLLSPAEGGKTGACGPSAAPAPSGLSGSGQ